MTGQYPYQDTINANRKLQDYANVKGEYQSTMQKKTEY